MSRRTRCIVPRCKNRRPKGQWVYNCTSGWSYENFKNCGKHPEDVALLKEIFGEQEDCEACKKGQEEGR